MTWSFVSNQDGYLLAWLGDISPGFNETLSDSIGSRAPRGHPDGPSTYWIKEAETGLRQAADGDVILFGNSTSLIKSGDDVVAHSLYELFDNEKMPVEEFRSGLHAWRDAIDAAAESGSQSTA